MKYFVLEGEHLVPFEQRDPAVIAEHRAFLQNGYERGHFLLSGPQVPPNGGFLVARAETRDALDRMLEGEPFVRDKLMHFVRITEFDPVQHQPVLAEWFGRTG